MSKRNSKYPYKCLAGGLFALLAGLPTASGIASPPPASSPSVAESQIGITSVAEDSGEFIDVIVAWTEEAGAGYGDMTGVTQSLIDQANQAFINSEIDTRLRLVHVYVTDYDTSGSVGTAVGHLYDPDDGHADEIHALRDSYGADIAVLISYFSAGGMAKTTNADESEAFAVVNAYSPEHSTSLSFVHEIGHLLGASHNPEDLDGTASYSYGHGYVYGNGFGGWQTIMGIAICAYCSPYKIPYFSNPDVSYGGIPTGTATTHDNARVIDERAYEVANFRTQAPSSITITDARCYALNDVSWSPSDHASDYELWGSTSSSFTNPWLIYKGSGTHKAINQAGVYVRVRACFDFGCSGYREASSPTTYFNGCL